MNSFATVVAANIKGSADITNGNGRVEVQDINGNAMLKTTFGTVTARNVNGNLTATGQNSRVEAHTIRGNGNVSTTFGSVELRDVTGALKVTNSNGRYVSGGVETSLRIRGLERKGERSALAERNATEACLTGWARRARAPEFGSHSSEVGAPSTSESERRHLRADSLPAAQPISGRDLSSIKLVFLPPRATRSGQNSSAVSTRVPITTSRSAMRPGRSIGGVVPVGAGQYERNSYRAE